MTGSELGMQSDSLLDGPMVDRLMRDTVKTRYERLWCLALMCGANDTCSIEHTLQRYRALVDEAARKGVAV
jgi:hypothetical protein